MRLRKTKFPQPFLYVDQKSYLYTRPIILEFNCLLNAHFLTLSTINSGILNLICSWKEEHACKKKLSKKLATIFSAIFLHTWGSPYISWLIPFLFPSPQESSGYPPLILFCLSLIFSMRSAWCSGSGLDPLFSQQGASSWKGPQPLQPIDYLCCRNGDYLYHFILSVYHSNLASARSQWTNPASGLSLFSDPCLVSSLYHVQVHHR